MAPKDSKGKMVPSSKNKDKNHSSHHHSTAGPSSSSSQPPPPPPPPPLPPPPPPCTGSMSTHTDLATGQQYKLDTRERHIDTFKVSPKDVVNNLAVESNLSLDQVQASTGGFVFHNNKVLLIRRPKKTNDPEEPEAWEWAGGKVDLKEDKYIISGVIREYWEETHLIVIPRRNQPWKTFVGSFPFCSSKGKYGYYYNFNLDIADEHDLGAVKHRSYLPTSKLKDLLRAQSKDPNDVVKRYLGQLVKAKKENDEKLEKYKKDKKKYSHYANIKPVKLEHDEARWIPFNVVFDSALPRLHDSNMPVLPMLQRAVNMRME